MGRIIKFNFGYKDYLHYLKYGVLANAVRLEASSMCQLNCCSRTAIKNSIIGYGYLKFFNFKKIVNENPWVKKIELSNLGEIFLNKDLKDIIKYAYCKRIALYAATGVNLNNVSQDMIEYLVKYKFRYLTVAIDGATDRIYQIYRRGGKLENVLGNIKRISYFKKIYRSRYPKLCWQFIIFGHNEEEIPIAREKARKLGMDFQTKLNAVEKYSAVRDKRFVRIESGLGVANREEFRQKKKRMYILPCLQFWFSPQINWDGRLLGCCFNTYSDFGNVFKSGLRESLKSEKFIYAKKMLSGQAKPRSDIACSKCRYYIEYKDYIASEVPNV